MDLISDQLFLVLLKTFGNRTVHISNHTVIELAIPFPTHILTLDQSATKVSAAKEGGGAIVIQPGNINSSAAREVSSTSSEDQIAKDDGFTTPAPNIKNSTATEETSKTPDASDNGEDSRP